MIAPDTGPALVREFRRVGARFPVTLVLDSGAVTAVALNRHRLPELRAAGAWPAEISAVVLTEVLTGDRRRDHPANRLLAMCIIREVDELQARGAARLRTMTGRADTISAVDAVVVALASQRPGTVVLTTDIADLRALAEHAATVIDLDTV